MSLPPEIWGQIWKCLAQKQAAELRRICRFWDLYLRETYPWSVNERAMEFGFVTRKMTRKKWSEHIVISTKLRSLHVLEGGEHWSEFLATYVGQLQNLRELGGRYYFRGTAAVAVFETFACALYGGLVTIAAVEIIDDKNG